MDVDLHRFRHLVRQARQTETGQCALFGHGPGPTSLFSGPADAFHVVVDPDANLAAYVGATRTEVAA